ncbi:MAG TPA: acyl carrier protein [Elusimicrobia bacterium]|nr:MAG: acyl carrier protein [Elusimicrobia bacterium RIFOXYA12_FULL_49_49]OGS07357.1 MAG: acyl carrier protein [Elusimicrobia bacterium RIFOXYA1_FULL_47_7]OGS11360.1 MAG: acyl carrier protein [Elusimicrobia bacterium RIFOXYB1_FULL_48_9]OGS15401.1 MAG: acyl carrier protein [Elusimicrobia bacterium RIFOXYA2_FULL_47_53]OGS26259.1 MAG: acyl carrier protein [Elusimicrobia bacterium RIFOXYB12_FULL_50_12]OGS30829.1 MAG: acyl carrier protein [Elusimicrobia bacterium RIFOXYB2_FULL_46_23]HBU69115.1 ac
MNKEEIKTSVVEFIRNNFLLGAEAVKFGNSDSFLEKGIIDSTGVLELVAFLEENFKVKVTDTEMTPENLDSVDKLADYITKKTA